MMKNNVTRNERLMLKGSLKKNGFERWRFITNAVSLESGLEKVFFIEFYILNPQVSPEECVLGFKNRFEKTAEDLQYALAGTESAESAASQKFVVPSFTMVRAGYFGAGGRQVSAYFPNGQIEFGKNEFVIRAGKGSESECVFASDYCFGKIKVLPEDLSNHPEFLCSSGEIEWNLKFEKGLPFHSDSNAKISHWAVLGGKCDCEGKIIANGEEFSVTPIKSCAFFDKNWGHDFANPFIHLNSSNLTSQITGKTLLDSCFAVQGEYNGTLSVLASVEGKNIEFYTSQKKKQKISYECSEVNSDDVDNSGSTLHWSVSASSKKIVVDIDIFCHADEMFLRDYESPCGGRKLMRVLAGTGNGELRIYKGSKKNLELLEHITVAGCTCEYGNIEYPEK